MHVKPIENSKTESLLVFIYVLQNFIDNNEQ